MGTIKLNLKARQRDPKKESSWAYIWKRKGIFKEVKNHIGIKTARALVSHFKALPKRSGICPIITRLSFSTVKMSY